MPPRIEITTEDAQLVEKELQLRLIDAERLAVLKEVNSCDVQAGPGSGKTTILTAKLAILAKKWPFRDRGVCVLSHTNAARREIEKKLSRSADLRRLIRYPHFIGTIQTFVDQFLALPFLRQNGGETISVDDDRFASQALKVYFSGSYPAISKWIYSPRFKNHDKAGKERLLRGAIGSLSYEGTELGVTTVPRYDVPKIPSSASASGAAFVKIKHAVTEAGYFRYHDMFAYGERALAKKKWLPTALRRRFPWVFVDELQDTLAMQDRIIEQLFAAAGCVFQRFGDKNQAIFGFDADADERLSLFERRKTLLLNSTHRFGKSIASLISPLTAVEPQTIVGNPERPDLDHTVFIFDRVAVKRVVPRFGDLVLNKVPQTVLQEHSVCVIGNRVNWEQHARDNFPAYLGDYVDRFVSPKAIKPAKPDTLLAYIVEARGKWTEAGTGAEPYNSAISGILAFLRRARPNDTQVLPRTKAAVHQAMLQGGRFATFQKLLWSLLNPTVALDEQLWSKCMGNLLDVLGCPKPTKETADFLVWEHCDGAGSSSGAKSEIITENVYRHRAGDVELPIRLDSIHGVKGETHAATLVVETFAMQHDLKELLPVLTSQKHGSQLKDSLRSHCKRLFVAMSRPTHLLCLAIWAEHINGTQAAALERNGWKVVRCSYE